MKRLIPRLKKLLWQMIFIELSVIHQNYSQCNDVCTNTNICTDKTIQVRPFVKV